MFRPYKYKKQQVFEDSNKETWEFNLHIEPLDIKFKWLASTVLTVSGLFLIANQILLPWLKTPRAQKPLLKPSTPGVLAETAAVEPEREGGGIKVEFEFEFSELRRDIETPNQTPSASVRGKQENIPEVFYLTIPKLGIERAEVETNSESLTPDERLGHYTGSALPGEVGNTFIYGHSVSPMFFNPKDYKTIFTTLDTLGERDEVTVEFGGKFLKYVVEELIVLDPEDVNPLDTIAPTFLRQSHLTLMTCVPPGIRTKRLLVQTKLQN